MSRLTVRTIGGLAAATFIAAFHFGAQSGNGVKPAPAFSAAASVGPQPTATAAPRLRLSRVAPLPALRRVSRRRTAARPPVPTATPTATPTPTPTAAPTAIPVRTPVPAAAPVRTPVPSFVGKHFDSSG